ncbi:MAG: hypothetical protein ACRD4Y_08410, partial [Candidatus Acidiferrales bacterium]
IHLDPKNFLTRFLRAYLSYSAGGLKGNAEQIETDLRSSIAANPNFAPAFSLLATCLTATDSDLPEALESAKNGVSLEPGSSHYQIVLAGVLAQLRQYEQAEAVAVHARANSSNPQEREGADQFIAYLHRLELSKSRRDEHETLPSKSDATPDTAKKSKNPGGSETSVNSNEAQKFTIIETPPDQGRKMADGQVVNVQCRVQEMLVTISTENGPVRLHVADYSKVDFISDVPLKSDVYYPCTELKGKSVKATFFPKPSKSRAMYEGEIERVEVKD